MRLALAGDTMLGRGVAEALKRQPPASLIHPEVVAAAREADLFVLNLECCISERGDPWPDPRKPFFFRAPPNAVDLLIHLGVDCVTLANNHALDFGRESLVDTFTHLEAAGIAWVGAGRDLDEARALVTLEAKGFPLAVMGVTDHPAAYAAGPGAPGVAFADLEHEGVPPWLVAGVKTSARPVMVCAHWGPNMSAQPVPHVRTSAAALVEVGAALVAGHSAHVFQGVARRVLYDLGDFIDDYRSDPRLRNDLGLLWLVDFDREGPRRLEAVPLALDYCYTRPAAGQEVAWIRDRFQRACAALGSRVWEEGGRLVMSLGPEVS